jgi:hypothetical protein
VMFASKARVHPSREPVLLANITLS